MDIDATRTLKEAVKDLLRSNFEDDAPSLLAKLIAEFPDATTKQVKNVAQRIRKSEGLGHAQSSPAPVVQKQPSTSLPSASIQIRDVLGKGKGVIAAKTFERGEVIIVEAPILSLSKLERKELEIYTSGEQAEVGVSTLQRQFQELTRDDQAKVMDLHDAHMQGGKKTISGIVKTNAFQCHEKYSNVFLTISRFNCSCSPNAAAVWRGTELRQLVYATRPIDAGEEICISYFGSSHACTKIRRRRLFDRYGYLCRCIACENNSPASDARREQISALEESIRGSQPVMPHEFLAVVMKLLDLYKEEDILTPATVARLSDEAMETCAILRKPRLTTLKWASQALDNYKLVYGDTDVATARAAEYVRNCRDQKKYNRWIQQVLEKQGVPS